MDLTPEQFSTIWSASIAGQAARVWLFGSRADDLAQGGNVDLLIELDEPVEPPACLATQLYARVSRAMQGRGVDVVVKAFNLKLLPIQTIAMREGVQP